MKNFHVTLNSPDGLVLSDEAQFVLAPGAQGSLGILADHAALVTTLDRGVMEIRFDDKTRYFAINRGILEVNDQHRVLILADLILEKNSSEEAKASLKEFAQPAHFL